MTQSAESMPASGLATDARARRRRSSSAAGRILRPILVMVLAAMLVAVGAGLDRAGFLPGAPTADPAGASPAFQLVRQAWDLLHEDYVASSELDDTTLSYAAIRALATAIGDTGHTSFETPADLAAEQAALSGRYVGIGVVLEPESGGAVMTTVYPASPAARAGLIVGDSIIAVDGRDAAGLSLSNLSSLIAGPAGSPVTLTVRPVAGGPARKVVLMREPVTIPVVEWAIVPGSRIADIHIDQFSDGATTTLIAALKAARAAGADGVVLDLRGNPGGLVSEAAGVASQFLESGDVYLTRDASGHETAVPVEAGGVALRTPLVVLVDHGTASSAEIVATALQDAHRATIVGETTFGTGTILGQFSLADGSALRIGTVEWLTRDGRSIWHHGLTPDDIVALGKGDQPVTTTDLRNSSPGQIADVHDAQFHAALEAVQQAVP